MAILLDGRVLSAPVIAAEIVAGKVNIAGNFTEIEAANLVWRLNRLHPQEAQQKEVELALEFNPEQPITHQPAGIDLDRGEILKWPAETGDWNESKMGRWSYDTGVDLLHVVPENESSLPRLGLLGMRLVILYPDAWANLPSRTSLLESITKAKGGPREIAEKRFAAFHPDLRVVSAEPPLPIIYGFCTTEGTVGVLQLVELNKNSRPLKIRYKVASDETVETATTTQPKPIPASAALLLAETKSFVQSHTPEDFRKIEVQKKLAGQQRELEILLAGTIAEPLMKELRRQKLEMQNAESDQEKFHQAADKIKSIGDEIEKLIQQADDSTAR